MFTSITVLGAGTMGYGIALDFARGVADVRLLDVTEEAVRQGMANIDISLSVFCDEGLMTREEAERIKSRVRPFTDLGEAVKDTDMVLEALPEIMDLKHDVLRKTDALAPAHAVFVTNTSSLRPSEIFSVVSPARRTRCALAHYFHPPEIIPLVEVMPLEETDEAVMTDMWALYESINKVPVRVCKELPGLCVNRIQMAVWREVLWQLENGVASKEDLDRVLTYGPALRWATTGVLTVMDLGGLDVGCRVADNIMKDLANPDNAGPAMHALFDAGHYGLKTGQGFFSYPESERTKIKNAYVRRLAKQQDFSLKNLDKGKA